MASLEQFAERMRELGRRVETQAPEVTRQVALAVDQVLVTSTPVDTGRARSNWLASTANPVRRTIDALAPGAAATQPALDEARRVIEQYEGEVGIYISNNLPYIARLNEGSSAQAPAGFVEEAIRTGVAAIRGARLLR